MMMSEPRTFTALRGRLARGVPLARYTSWRCGGPADRVYVPADRDDLAQVSQLHCNFLINRGNATAADIESLGETVCKRVKENSGVELEWEIKRIGVAAG